MSFPLDEKLVWQLTLLDCYRRLPVCPARVAENGRTHSPERRTAGKLCTSAGLHHPFLSVYLEALDVFVPSDRLKVATFSGLTSSLADDLPPARLSRLCCRGQFSRRVA